MEFDTETRVEAGERLARAATILPIGFVFVLVALVVALIVAFFDIFLDAVFGDLTLVTQFMAPLVDASQTVTDWWVANLFYIALGQGDPDVTPF